MKNRIYKLVVIIALILVGVTTLNNGLDAGTGITMVNNSTNWNVSVVNGCGIYYLKAGQNAADANCVSVSVWTIDDDRSNHFALPANFSGTITLHDGRIYIVTTTTTNITIIDDSRTG